MEPNPIHHHRLSIGMSSKHYAEKIGLSYITLLRIEQGLYNEIPPIVFNSFPNKLHNKLKEDYKHFQVQQRKAHGPLVEVPNKKLISPIPEIYLTDEQNYFLQPLLWWRMRSGFKARLDFCKAYCLHPSTVISYESGKINRTPRLIQEVLMDAGYSSSDITELGRRYQLWRYYMATNKWPVGVLSA